MAAAAASAGQAFIITTLPERPPWVGRVNHTLTHHQDGKLYRYGGRLMRPQIDVPGPYYSELEVLVPLGCTWESAIGPPPGEGGDQIDAAKERVRRKKNASNEPGKRGDHTAVVVSTTSDHRLFIIGGRVQNQVFADIFAYDFFEQSWASLPFESSSGPGPIFGHCAAASSVTRRIYVTGGWHSRAWRTPLWAFETTTSSWIEIKRPPHVKSEHVNLLRRCAIAWWEGVVYVAGWHLTPPDAQPFISTVPLLAYNESRDEWSEVAAVGSPPIAMLFSLALANAVVMPQLGCWTFLCIGQEFVPSLGHNSTLQVPSPPQRQQAAPTKVVASGGSNAAGNVTVSRKSDDEFDDRASSVSRLTKVPSQLSVAVPHRPPTSPGAMSSSKAGGSNKASSSSVLTRARVKSVAASQQSSSSTVLPQEAAGALLVAGGSHLPRKTSTVPVHPPSLWSFHFATCRWIQHAVVISPTTDAMDFHMSTLVSHLSEQNTDPFENKYQLVPTGADTLVLWGGCLDRDHLAIRLKLSDGSPQAQTMVKSLIAAQHVPQVLAPAYSGNSQSSSTRSASMSARSAASLNGNSVPLRRFPTTQIGIALPLVHHRNMRISYKQKSSALRMVDLGGNAATSKIGKEGDEAASHQLSHKPLRLANNCPVVRVATVEQVQSWKRTYYNEQLDWLFTLHAKDRRRQQQLQLQQQQDEKSGRPRLHPLASLTTDLDASIGGGGGGVEAPPSSAAGATANAAVPRFMRSTAGSSHKAAEPASAGENQQQRADELAHRRHGPTSISLNTLSNVATSIAWPLFAVRNLPAGGNVTAVKLRWLLVKRYVMSGWAGAGVFPSESTLQSWAAGRKLPKRRSTPASKS